MQVRGYVEVQAGAVCKTVGSAYVGSNPTPATTCGNGPLAANSRAGGPFLLCPVVCHLVALQTGVLLPGLQAGQGRHRDPPGSPAGHPGHWHVPAAALRCAPSVAAAPA